MKHSTAKRIGALLLAVLLLFVFAACTKPAEPSTNVPSGPGTETDPNTGGDKPIQTGPAGPVKDPGPLKGEKEGAIPVPLRMNRELKTHEKAFTRGEYGEGMVNGRVMTFSEPLTPEDGATFPELAAALEAHFTAREPSLLSDLDALCNYAESLSDNELFAYLPVGFLARDGMILGYETTLCRADTRVVSFTEELFTNAAEDVRSFTATNIDTQTGAVLTLDDVLDKKDEAMAWLEGEVKKTFEGVDPPEEYAFAVGCQGLTFFFDYPEADFLADEPTITLSFADHPEFVKSYYRDVPDAFAVPLKTIAEHGFDTDGDGTPERIEAPGEWGENWLLYKNGKTWLANFTNDYDPWEGLMDAETDWQFSLYEIDESGPNFLMIYPGKPLGNCLTDPDDIRLQTGVEMVGNYAGDGSPYVPITMRAAIREDGSLTNLETGEKWSIELPDYEGTTAFPADLFGEWSTSFVADGAGNEIMLRLTFFENGYMKYSYDKGDGNPIELFSGRYRMSHNMPGAQWSGGYYPFVFYPIDGTAYDGKLTECWSMNAITFPEYDNWDTIRIDSEGGLPGAAGAGFRDTVFYRTWN